MQLQPKLKTFYWTEAIPLPSLVYGNIQHTKEKGANAPSL
jgi:hypothetical protein